MKCLNGKCKLISLKLHIDGFCSTSCRNQVKKLNPISGYRDCLLCEIPFPYRNTANVRSSYSVELGLRVGSKLQKFCSRLCSIQYKNKFYNPAKIASVAEKISIAAKNRGVAHMHTPQARARLSVSISGNNHWNWQGGITNKNKSIRNTARYKAWRTKIFKRDNYACVQCSARSAKGKPVVLNVDHIKPFSLFPKLRFTESNGRTLCLECHKLTDTYMGRTRRIQPK